MLTTTALFTGGRRHQASPTRGRRRRKFRLRRELRRQPVHGRNPPNTVVARAGRPAPRTSPPPSWQQRDSGHRRLEPGWRPNAQRRRDGPRSRTPPPTVPLSEAEFPGPPRGPVRAGDVVRDTFRPANHPHPGSPLHPESPLLEDGIRPCSTSFNQRASARRWVGNIRTGHRGKNVALPLRWKRPITSTSSPRAPPITACSTPAR